jgi:hypothetical protein
VNDTTTFVDEADYVKSKKEIMLEYYAQQKLLNDSSSNSSIV